MAASVPLPDLLGESDLVTLHLPLTAETHHLIGREQIEVMKQGAMLVNTGRGALVDTAALVAALEVGRLGGAGLDVVEGEEIRFRRDRAPRSADDRLLRQLHQLPNVVVTPHVAYRTARMLRETVEVTLERCLAFEGSRSR